MAVLLFEAKIWPTGAQNVETTSSKPFSALKAKVALEAVRSELPLAELAEKYDVHATQVAGIRTSMPLAGLSMRVSHETIYTALHAMLRGELRTELLATLSRRAKRVVHVRMV